MLPFTHKQLEFLFFVNSLDDWNHNKLPEIVFPIGTEFEDWDIYCDRVPLNEEEYQQLITTLQDYSPGRLFDLQSCLVLLTQF